MTDDCGPDCQETLREIERFLDGELDPTLHVRVQEHLTGCSPCLHRMEFRRHLKVLIARTCRESEAPPGFEGRLVRMIRELDTAG